MNKNFKNMSIGAIASVIAGAYYIYGSKEGVAKRKQIAAWSVKMKGEVLQGIEKLKDVSEPAYKDIVKKVSEKYKTVDKGELKKVVDDLHSTWNKMKKEVNAEIAKKQAQIQKETKGKVTAVKKAVKKVVAKKKAPAAAPAVTDTTPKA
jgi:Tfp pilus assembly protein FimV